MPVQGQSFVVIGGAGLVGSAVAAGLEAQSGANIIICDHFGALSDHKWARLPKNLTDIWQPEALVTNLDKAWRDIAGVIVLADAGPATTDVDAIFEAAFHLPRRIWDFCVAKQRPMFWASSAHVYGPGPSRLDDDPSIIANFEPVSAFGQAKRAFDLFAARQGHGPHTPPVTAGVRLSNVYGAGESHKGQAASLPARAMAHARAGTTMSFWAGSDMMARDFVHVDDAATAIIEVITGQKSGYFDIGTGQTHTIKQLCSAVEEVTKSPLKSDWTASSIGPIVSLPPADTAALTTQFRSLAAGLASL